MHLLAVKLKATRKPHKSTKPTKPSTNQPNDKQTTHESATNCIIFPRKHFRQD